MIKKQVHKKTVQQMNIIPLSDTMNGKIKKNASQIKFSAFTIKQQIKLVLRHSLGKICHIDSSVTVAQFHLQYFLFSQRTHNTTIY